VRSKVCSKIEERDKLLVLKVDSFINIQVFKSAMLLNLE
jgi:hypothetical protein